MTSRRLRLPLQRLSGAPPGCHLATRQEWSRPADRIRSSIWLPARLRPIGVCRPPWSSGKRIVRADQGETWGVCPISDGRLSFKPVARPADS